jgi:hypothetical protein
VSARARAASEEDHCDPALRYALPRVGRPRPTRHVETTPWLDASARHITSVGYLVTAEVVGCAPVRS